MTQYLCISVTFLDPLFHGKGDDGPEWPPSPMRLFQALLAGARTGCRGNEWTGEKVDAFHWLEQLDPPVIVAPGGHKGSAYRLAVPNNDWDVSGSYWARGVEPPDNKQPPSLRAMKQVRPHWLRDMTVHYLWPMDESGATEQRAELICREARHLLALGWGIDQVVGNGRIITDTEAAALHGERWCPWDGQRPGEPTCRVPTRGSLDDLEKVHKSFLQRVHGNQYAPPLKLSRFGTVSYLSGNTLPARSYAVFELPEGVAFRQGSAAKVAAMLRSLASRAARADTHQFPGGSETYVAGHAGKQELTPERFSFLPLATIGHQNADGMIRRLLIAEPFSGSGDHARWAQNRLRNETIWDEQGNERGVVLDLWRQASRAIIGRYVDRASAWCTVTPVILPGFDDGKLAKAERLLLVAIRQAGVPIEAVRDVTMRKAPFWPGSQHPRQYFVPDYLRGLPGWHVRLVFHEPVPGPLSLGAGRHAGLGVFARSED